MELTLQSEALDKLLPALLQVQATMAPALKTASNPHLKSKYATLGDVWEAIREPLHKNGLVVVQAGEHGDDAAITVVTTLYHTSGQWLRSRLRVPLEKTTPQVMGSAISYARRYGLSAILGVVTEDDDGHAASQGKPPRAARAPQSAPSAPQNGGAPPAAIMPGKPASWDGWGGKPMTEVPTPVLGALLDWIAKDPERQAKFAEHRRAANAVIDGRLQGSFDEMPPLLVPQPDDLPF